MFHGVADLIFRRRLELPIGDQLDAEHETRSPHVADDCVNEHRQNKKKSGSGEVTFVLVRKKTECFLNKIHQQLGQQTLTLVLLLETAEAVLEVGADDEGVLLEPLLLEHLEDGESAGGAQRVAAERVEVAAPGQHLRDLRRRHHGAQRDAVADALKNPGVRPGSERRVVVVDGTEKQGLEWRVRTFAMVTMSGTTPWVSKPQKWLPTRAKPAWTSSAMQSPPAFRTFSYASGR